MKTDALFFRFFKELPSCFFQLIGRPETDALRYNLDAIEYKETAVRLDGIFQPHQPEVDPAYIWELQAYRLDTVYANLMTKIGRFLEHGNPEQDWIAVVIYATRSFEPPNLRPYRCLVESDQLVRVYLDELPPAPPDKFELGLLDVIMAKPDAAMAKAKAMVPQIRVSDRPPDYQWAVIQLIETAIVQKFPEMTTVEIENMLELTDIRKTRVFQEALEEGMEKGMEKGREEGIEKVALKLIQLKRPISEIAKATGLTAAQIRKLKKTHEKK
jgi:predicted transposase/invertase (TIGR01784 family)